MTEPRIVTPEEAQQFLDGPLPWIPPDPWGIRFGNDLARTVATEPDRIRAAQAEAWDEGVKTALNFAVRNEDGVTLRLEYVNGQPWINPYRGDPFENPFSENGAPL